MTDHPKGLPRWVLGVGFAALGLLLATFLLVAWFVIGHS